MVICPERDADLHVAQLMPLPLTVSCFSKIQVGFTFLVPADLDSHGKRAVKRVCVSMVQTATYTTRLVRISRMAVSCWSGTLETVACRQYRPASWTARPQGDCTSRNRDELMPTTPRKQTVSSRTVHVTSVKLCILPYSPVICPRAWPNHRLVGWSINNCSVGVAWYAN